MILFLRSLHQHTINHSFPRALFSHLHWKCNIEFLLGRRFSSTDDYPSFDTAYSTKVCQWLATGRWFSPGLSVSSTNKTDRHDITEILFEVALNTIKQKTYKRSWIWRTVRMSYMASWRHLMLLAIYRRRTVSSLIGIWLFPIVCPCCLCISNESIIHMLLTDVLILTWSCNSRTITTRSVIGTVCGVKAFS